MALLPLGLLFMQAMGIPPHPSLSRQGRGYNYNNDARGLGRDVRRQYMKRAGKTQGMGVNADYGLMEKRRGKD
jgi:hypothetical protein